MLGKNIFTNTLLVVILTIIDIEKIVCSVIPAKDFISPFNVPFQLALTPLQTAKISTNEKFECTPGSVLDTISLSAADFPFQVTCNGLNSQKFPFIFLATINGTKENLSFESLEVTTAFLNGYVIEQNLGEITSGRCAGDRLSSIGIYVPVDQLVCDLDKGISKYKYIFYKRELSGPKCRSTCSLASGSISITPPLSNSA